jgi:hypothetical protein
MLRLTSARSSELLATALPAIAIVTITTVIGATELAAPTDTVASASIAAPLTTSRRTW